MGQLFGEDENEAASEELDQAEKDGESGKSIGIFSCFLRFCRANEAF